MMHGGYTEDTKPTSPFKNKKLTPLLPPISIHHTSFSLLCGERIVCVCDKVSFQKLSS